MFCYREQIKLLKEILREIKEFRHELFPSKLIINFAIGDINYMSDVTLTLTPPTKSNGTVTEIFKGQPYVPVPGDLTWSVQDGTIVGFVQNADGSATFSPLAVGSTQVGCSDKTTGLAGVGTVNVAAGPDGLTIIFSPPA